MNYFPTFVNVAGRRIIVIGGGEMAAQKLRLLEKTSAQVELIAPNASIAAAQAYSQDNSARRVRHVAQDFDPTHLGGASMVFAASEVDALNMVVANAAKARGIPVNVVDRPAISTFIVPAIVDRDPLVVAVSSGGTAPVLACDVRAHIETWLPSKIGEVASQAGKLRQRIKAEIADINARRKFWRMLLKGSWRDAVLKSDSGGASEHIESAIAAARAGGRLAGRVTLVGAGPGDPDLLTLRAQHRLQEADVIVVDGLVPEAVLETARRDARRIRVGKTGYAPSIDQADINRILIREAKKGNDVVRLKCGDPFVFGRAVEEMLALSTEGIEVDVVPGVTAAFACAAAIGLPVTQRSAVRQFTIITGATAGGLPDLDWPSLAKPGQAFAVYMGVRTVAELSANLLTAGASPATPIIIVIDGTRPGERVIETELASVGAVVDAMSVKGPAIIFVGLSWDEAGLTRPMHVETSLSSPVFLKPDRSAGDYTEVWCAAG